MRRIRLSATIFVVAAVTLLLSLQSVAAQEDCLTNKQALDGTYKTSNNTSTYRVTGFVGPTGTKIAAYAGRFIGCVVVEEGREYQYLLVEGDPSLTGLLVTFKKNGKEVKVAEEFEWEPATVKDVEILKPRAQINWMQDILNVSISNLADTHLVRLETSQPRPWGEVFENTLSFDIHPTQTVTQSVECIGIYLPGTWQLFLNDELLDTGILPPQECEHVMPVVFAQRPTVGIVGMQLVIYGAGFGRNSGEVQMRLRSFSNSPSIISWDNWMIRVQLSQLLEIGTWDLNVLSLYRDGHIISNTVPLQIREPYRLYLPRIERRMREWR